MRFHIDIRLSEREQDQFLPWLQAQLDGVRHGLRTTMSPRFQAAIRRAMGHDLSAGEPTDTYYPEPTTFLNELSAAAGVVTRPDGGTPGERRDRVRSIWNEMAIESRAYIYRVGYRQAFSSAARTLTWMRPSEMARLQAYTYDAFEEMYPELLSDDPVGSDDAPDVETEAETVEPPDEDVSVRPDPAGNLWHVKPPEPMPARWAHEPEIAPEPEIATDAPPEKSE